MSLFYYESNKMVGALIWIPCRFSQSSLPFECKPTMSLSITLCSPVCLRGPLHGIPIGLKDLFDTAGAPTTANSRVLRDRVSLQDAAVASRLRVAGSSVGQTPHERVCHRHFVPGRRRSTRTQPLEPGSYAWWGTIHARSHLSVQHGGTGTAHSPV